MIQLTKTIKLIIAMILDHWVSCIEQFICNNWYFYLVHRFGAMLNKGSQGHYPLRKHKLAVTWTIYNGQLHNKNAHYPEHSHELGGRPTSEQ